MFYSIENFYHLSYSLYALGHLSFLATGRTGGRPSPFRVTFSYTL